MGVIMFFHMFMILFYLTVDEHLSMLDKENIFTKFPINAHYLSQPFFNNTNINSKDFVNMIQNNNLNSFVGFELLDTKAQINETHTTLVYLNEYLSKFHYPLTKGKWLNKTKKNGIVIGGALTQKYNIGDKVSLTSSKHTEEAEIIGIMGIDYKFMFLNVAGKNLNFGKILTQSNDNLILTLNMNFLSMSSCSLSTLALTVDEGKLHSVSNLGINTENKTPIREMNNINSKSEYINVHNKVMLITMLFSIVFSIVYQIYIYILKSKESILILYEQGMSYIELSLVLTFPQFLNMLAACTLEIIYRLVTHSEKKQIICWDISILFSVLFLITILVHLATRRLLKKTMA
ncbi:hypothetical protein [[Clostridium] polysaccharolyticum]|nr:hypothetical protein [[Clostridium] polysaccharolyticum]